MVGTQKGRGEDGIGRQDVQERGGWCTNGRTGKSSVEEGRKGSVGKG
jgi:hypothetical protein